MQNISSLTGPFDMGDDIDRILNCSLPEAHEELEGARADIEALLDTLPQLPPDDCVTLAGVALTLLGAVRRWYVADSQIGLLTSRRSTTTYH